jgi:hypothetical protein
MIAHRRLKASIGQAAAELKAMSYDVRACRMG